LLENKSHAFQAETGRFQIAKTAELPPQHTDGAAIGLQNPGDDAEQRCFPRNPKAP
jgi:hypothetical protein